MRLRFLTVWLVLAVPPALGAQVLTPRDSALHALNRLAYGPRRGEVDSVARIGVMRWIEGQLAFERLPDDRLTAREREFKLLRYDREELAQRYSDAVRERREMQREMAQSGDTTRPRGTEGGPLREFRELGGELQQLAGVRAAPSERQLRGGMVDFLSNYFHVFVGGGGGGRRRPGVGRAALPGGQLGGVMVDFWSNLFNVLGGKGADLFLPPSYIEQTFRPNALGRFEDLLTATAKSPAMLFYLDNVQ